MVKHTRRRGGTWYDPRTWFSSTPTAVEQSSTGLPSDSTLGAPPAAASTSPYGGRKGKKSRRGKRRGTKSHRKH